jgi:transcriptional regulator with XRE-family HTH domain
MSLSSRLKQVRKDKELSQQQLANLSNVHISNIGRYERGDAQPSAEVLNRIAGVLEVSPDFLINGTIEDKAESSLSDNDLLNQFRKVEKLPDDKKRLVKEFLDAFLFKYNISQQIIAS